MAGYQAPLRDIRFVLRELAGIDGVAQLPGYEDATPDLIEAILDEAAKFAAGVLAPLNASGDREGVRWHDHAVSTASGFREAYAQFVDSGWNGLSCDTAFGGQGLPRVLSTAVQEMWMAANISFSLCPLLNAGAIDALHLCGSEAQQALYLPRMVTGAWTGTMNITEPQAGSDLAAIRARAEPQPDGSYRIFGQKIFITYGEHDMADNIVHLVLARTSGAPEGVKGLSLFVVPKFLVNADGAPGRRNDVKCVSVERKLGIHASPTCIMAFGDEGDGAVGELVGEENAGLRYMFVMMNSARFGVGLQGLGVAERATQHALAYARERIQGRDIAGGDESVAIIRHPDVRRMLMLMKSQTEAMRALAYCVGAAMDAAARHADAAERRRQQAFVDLMIPVVKGWLTETANEIAYLGVQVHGGMGFIEETGAAQYMRDARITTIYEGTTGIQANDLIGRKIVRDGGAVVRAVIDRMRATEVELRKAGGQLAPIGDALGRGIAAVEASVAAILAGHDREIARISAGAAPFLKLMGIVCGGWQMGRAALVAHASIAAGDADAFHPAKIATARFFARHVLVMAPALSQIVVEGGEAALAFPDDA